ncbi:MAG TPA: phosphatidylserine decarboxylase [Deltaproteobacteria bacterium]|nr:phosphatidylserine decarboxylase [Deltaproteobacteria bacterium]HOM30395.1 phosphatidylserine decarboxylase [Deltaproteobacteria bacterium]
MRIRREGLPFVAGAAAVLALALVFGGRAARLLAGLPVLFVTWFFRDPERVVPKGEGIVVSPADGEVIEVAETEEEIVGPCTKVAVFMNVFSVHVNRLPVSGRVRETRYRPGTFEVASLGKKTEANERMMVYIDTDHGTFRVDQVAGLVARRISCWLSPGDKAVMGERFGLIRFGSLLECWMPRGYKAVCERGQKVRAGESVIGRRSA